MQNPFRNGMIPIPPNYATLKNSKTGELKISKVGFSFTALIFGFVPAIFRGDWYNFFCIILVDFAIAMLASVISGQPIGTVYRYTEPISQVIWGLLYNLMYCRHLSNIGYVPTDQRSKTLLVNHKYIRAN
ncbi:hypothetical protein [Lactobacillus sp. Sy-1]|uniref:hypothetical protein n=1 Tax=Lactobacillus sp. Sy-1 TaxID=2109645 RepID=UPI0021039153|nr:hypothetical protein [Lactobacillus sp. Sy-1]